jgi:repressor LexA
MIMADKNDLTTTQANVLKFLKNFVGERGYPPTLREIASHFGLRGPKAPQKTLTILEKKGFIRRSPGGSRTIEILNSETGRSREAGEGLPYERGGQRGVSSDTDFLGSASVPTFPIPIVGRVTAGAPILALENIEGYIHLDRTFVSSKNVFLLRVQGDSMIDAHIQEGDFALVKPQATAENGEIVVALIEDEATIKRIFQERDLVRLEPANPTMEPILIKKKDKKVTIVGKVIGIFRKL